MPLIDATTYMNVKVMVTSKRIQRHSLGAIWFHLYDILQKKSHSDRDQLCGQDSGWAEYNYRGRVQGCFIGLVELFCILIVVHIKIIPNLLDYGVIHSSALVISRKTFSVWGRKAVVQSISLTCLYLHTCPKFEYGLLQYYF